MSPKSKNPDLVGSGLSWNSSLTMSYFHTGIRTIIGAEAFHCPVRDGKEWDHLAMVIRLKRLLRWGSRGTRESETGGPRTANSQSRAPECLGGGTTGAGQNVLLAFIKG